LISINLILLSKSFSIFSIISTFHTLSILSISIFLNPLSYFIWTLFNLILFVSIITLPFMIPNIYHYSNQLLISIVLSFVFPLLIPLIQLIYILIDFTITEFSLWLFVVVLSQILINPRWIYFDWRMETELSGCLNHTGILVTLNHTDILKIIN